MGVKFGFSNCGFLKRFFQFRVFGVVRKKQHLQGYLIVDSINYQRSDRQFTIHSTKVNSDDDDDDDDDDPKIFFKSAKNLVSNS